MSRRIAHAICSRRETAPIATTAELASVVVSAMPAAMRHGPIHPATRTFQALRIAVNGELDSLRRVLTAGVDRLSAGGRFAVIAFHSLEDRMVKEAFLLEAKRCLCPPDLPICVCGKEARLRVLTRKPLRPTEAEALANPRSRSARLRVAERL